MLGCGPAILNFDVVKIGRGLNLEILLLLGLLWLDSNYLISSSNYFCLFSYWSTICLYFSSSSRFFVTLLEHLVGGPITIFDQLF
jgi:hypothetical protein